MRIFYIFLIMLFFLGCATESEFPDQDYRQALDNGTSANEAFTRSQNFVMAWLDKADPESGLIPRNLDESKDFWNAQDAAADNYPFMVLTSFFTGRDMFEGRMKEMLNTERELTSRLGALPDTYSFSKNDFQNNAIDTGSLLFGASEYMKDGLLPLTEWLGPSPWSERMINILDDYGKYSGVVKFDQSQRFSSVRELEVNGELLQLLSRIYWMTGDQKYLDWAVSIGDYYLLGNNHPTQDLERLRLRDHGCEIISGLCELYATVNYALPDKKSAYQEPVHTMLDRILEIGRNEHGMFYNGVNPQNGEIVSEGIADTYGYTFNGYYTVYMIDSTQAYLDAINKALDHLKPHYQSYDWESGSADGYADAIESALNLVNRIPHAAAEEWIDSEMQIMFSMQDSSHRENALKWKGTGIIEGWHGDGNFARTAIMYALWKTKGTYVQPWRKDVKIGAVQTGGNELKISITAENSWQGKIMFDKPRHKEYLQLPVDWPRINQFPEWFTTSEDAGYAINYVRDGSEKYQGSDLQQGIPVELKAGETKFLLVSPSN